MKGVLLGVFVFSIALSAQTAPVALYRYPELAKRYEDALQSHPERLGGKLGDSPVFVGGQLYSYPHCVKLANWVIDNLGVESSMSVIQLGNLRYALDDSCDGAYDFYRCPESRLPASKIPVPPKQYAEDCANVGAAITIATRQYHERLDQVFAALPVTQKGQIENLLKKNASELPPHAFAWWLPEEFKPIGKDQRPTSERAQPTPHAKFPELQPRRPECTVLLPEKDERNDLAKLIRAEQFIRCERDGFPKDSAPPWKTEEEAIHGLENACDYFSVTSAKSYSHVGEENLALARTRCFMNIMTIEVTLIERALPN